MSQLDKTAIDDLAARIEDVSERRTQDITTIVVQQCTYIHSMLQIIAWIETLGFIAIVVAILYRSGFWPG